MLKRFAMLGGIAVCCFLMSGCEGETGVVADPAEAEQYNTPAEYDPASEQGPS